MANEPQKWAGLLGSGADVNTIPEETPTGTGAASMKSIFPPITQVPLSAGGIAPDRADFNGLFKLLGDNIYYQQQGGVYSYSATIDYAKGSLAKFNDRFYIAVQSNGPSGTVADPTNAIFWKPITLGDDYLHIAGGDVEGNVTIEGLNVVRSVNGETADEKGDVESIGRLAALSFAGKLAFTVDPYAGQTSFGRAIQGMAYDKNTNILYLTANYAGQGTFIFAYDYNTKACLGTNYDSSLSSRGAFYGAFEHQGFGLYHDQSNTPLFFSGGNRYIAPNTQDLAQCNTLNLLKWDYTDPRNFTVMRSWKLWASDYKENFRPNVTVSEDGTKIIAVKRRTDNSYSFGVWDISTVLSLSDNTVLESYATMYNSPWLRNATGQGLAFDDEYIYCLSSGASYTPHYISALSLNNKYYYDRSPSWEGAELPYEVNLIEGECLGFLPNKTGKSHLCMGVSISYIIDDVSHGDPFFYDLERLGGSINAAGCIKLGVGETGTSADYADLKTGTYYLPSGSMTDLSGGAWFLDVFSEDGIGPRRQIAYRGNDASDIRTRLASSDGAGDWVNLPKDSSVLHKTGEETLTNGAKTFDWSAPLKIQGSNRGNEFSTNARTLLELRANRDTAGESAMYISRLRNNAAQGSLGTNDNHVLTFDVLENGVRTNRVFDFTITGWENDIPKKAVFQTNNSNIAGLLGTNSRPWEEVHAKSILSGANRIDCAVDSMGTGYIRYANGLQICYGSANCSQGGTSNNLPMPFKDSSYTLTATYTGTINNVSISVARTASNTFTLYQSYSADVLTADYIAIGVWK